MRQFWEEVDTLGLEFRTFSLKNKDGLGWDLEGSGNFFYPLCLTTAVISRKSHSNYEKGAMIARQSGPHAYGIDV